MSQPISIYLPKIMVNTNYCDRVSNMVVKHFCLCRAVFVHFSFNNFFSYFLKVLSRGSVS